MKSKTIITLITIAGASLLATQGLLAEDAAKETTFADIFWKGKETFTALTIASILMVYFIIDGFMKLKVSRMAPPAFVAKAKELVRLGSYQELWEYCRTNVCFISHILQAGLERIGRGRDAAEAMMSEVALKEGTKLKENMTYLSVIGVIAPMIGLTGTVVGMIAAFKSLGTDGDPTGLSTAISKVLYATAGGLIVAVPAFVFYYYFRNRAQSCLLEAQNIINRIVDEIPFEELSGLQVGEAAAGGSTPAAPAATAAPPSADNPWGAATA